MIVRRQSPTVQMISALGLGLISLIAHHHYLALMSGFIGMVALAMASARREVMRIEVNPAGVHDNGLLVIAAADVVRAELVGNVLEIRGPRESIRTVSVWDVSRRGRRDLLAAIAQIAAANRDPEGMSPGEQDGR
jgi:hypothetical protein